MSESKLTYGDVEKTTPIFSVDDVFSTRDGKKARILATDIKCADYPLVVAVETAAGIEAVVRYTAQGRYSHHPGASGFDLLLPQDALLATLNIDDKVECSNDGVKWFKRHFAGLHANGTGLVFSTGATSFSYVGMSGYKLFRLPEVGSDA